MQTPSYYREEAACAEQLSHRTADPIISRMLKQLSRDYLDIAIDLEIGAVKVLHPAKLPQRQHPGPLK